jgi:hypothetical protein
MHKITCRQQVDCRWIQFGDRGYKTYIRPSLVAFAVSNFAHYYNTNSKIRVAIQLCAHEVFTNMKGLDPELLPVRHVG